MAACQYCSLATYPGGEFELLEGMRALVVAEALPMQLKTSLILSPSAFSLSNTVASEFSLMKLQPDDDRRGCRSVMKSSTVNQDSAVQLLQAFCAGLPQCPSSQRECQAQPVEQAAYGCSVVLPAFSSSLMYSTYCRLPCSE